MAFGHTQNIVAERVRTYEEQLKEYKIGMTRAELLRALQHEKLEVRWLAAGKLSDDDAKEAIPDLKKALAADKGWMNKINIGVALAWLGDASGLAALRETCRSAEPKYLRIFAARYLIEKDDTTCFDALLEILTKTDIDAKVGALGLLPRYKATHDYQQKSSKYIVAALADKSGHVQKAAISAVGSLGNEIAIPALEAAANQESDEDMRAALHAEIARLKTANQAETPKQ
ncbi:MAG: HEAT repeat domain-containing protein [Thermoanaerobaculia bacterium]|nr:HEAT repeat domain-containing protein [Thermoanaerobaculia bacterium]